MKNRFILLIIIISLFYSCTKNNTSTPSTERGTIIGNPVLIGTFNRAQVTATLGKYATIFGTNLHLNYDVDLYKIDYNTIDPKGSPTLASGLVVVPKDPSKKFPLMSYQHGTTLMKSNVASQLKGDFQVIPLFASDGYVLSCPDYLGFGDGTKLHPYLHAKSEASATIDMLRATRLLCKSKSISLNNQLFLIGYSQGGHATMATLKMIEEQFSTEFPVTACAPMAGPYDLSGVQLSFVMRDSAYATPGYLPYILFAYNPIYNMYSSLSTVFIPPYYDKFSPYFGDNPTSELSVVNSLWPSSMVPSAVLEPNIVESMMQNPNDPLIRALKDNDLYNWAPVSPMHLCHCDSDEQVNYQNSVVAYNSFISNGSTNVKLIMPLHGGTHETCVIPSFINTMVWFDSLRQ